MFPRHHAGSWRLKSCLNSVLAYPAAVSIIIYLSQIVCLLFSLTEVMDQLKENVPTLEKIVTEIEGLAHSGGKYHEAPHIIEVTLPMVCRSVVVFFYSGTLSSVIIR